MNDVVAKPSPDEDGNNGLCMSKCSQTTREICREVHSAFLFKHQISFWTTTIAPFGHPGLRVVSEDPNGSKRLAVVSKTTRFADDLMIFLDAAYAEWATAE